MLKKVIRLLQFCLIPVHYARTLQILNIQYIVLLLFLHTYPLHLNFTYDVFPSQKLLISSHGHIVGLPYLRYLIATHILIKSEGFSEG